ncbi:hypothetical protein [Actinomycetia phage DSL-LC01]|nr:hypothetical protein [Actinomycetia phage DSL-LC01]
MSFMADYGDADLVPTRRPITIKNVLMAIAIVAAALSALAIAARGERTLCPDIAVQVQPGDSAWLIAETHCDGNIENATRMIVERYGVVLQPGMLIDLP